MGDFLAVMIAVPLFPKQRLQLLHGVFTGSIALKQFPHHGGLLLVDHQPAAVLPITKDPAVAQHHTLLDGLLMTKLHTAGQLAQLILGDAGHDGQPQLAVLIQGVDVVILEKHPYPGGQQSAGILDGIQGISGKTSDLLGNDQIKKSRLSILDHPVEILPILCSGGREPLVNIAFHIGPVDIAANQILIIGYLVPQGIQLLIGLAGYPGVEGHPQGDVIDAHSPELLTYGVDIHVVPPKFVLS